MKNRDLEKSICNAIGKMPMPDVKGLAVLPVEKFSDFYEWIQEPKKETEKRSMKWLTAVVTMAVMIFCFTGIYVQQQTPVATVALDVNPSIELTINKQEKVLEAKGFNEEARIMLAGLEYKRKPLHQVVRALVGAMVQEGYLSQEKNTLMISVESKNLKQAEGIRDVVQDQVLQQIAEEKIEGEVIAQAFIQNKDSRFKAEELGISVGKMHLIEKIMENKKVVSIEGLEKKSIRELARELTKGEEEAVEPQDKPGPPVEPPGQTVEKPGPPVEPPGQNGDKPGPPVEPPGQNGDKPGPPVEPPGQTVDKPGPPVEPPGQTVDKPGPPVEPPGQTKEKNGPPATGPSNNPSKENKKPNG
jgi:hypothetical protein